MTLSRGAANDQLARAGLRAKRALGQNFVVDANTVRRIASLSGVGASSRVVEIGAGLGSLTLALAETGAQVTAVEVDASLLPLLAENTAAHPGINVIHADAMTLDWDGLLGGTKGWMVVANLPYNIATPLVADILDRVPAVSSLFVMVQKEVGERLAARPGDAAFGAVSVKVAFHAQARVVGTVPPSVFLPRPNVDSALVSIERHAEPPDPGIDRDLLFALVRAGFAKRRKMLRGALAGVATPAETQAAGIDPSRRAEELGVPDWVRLTRVITAARAVEGSGVRE